VNDIDAVLDLRSALREEWDELRAIRDSGGDIPLSADPGLAGDREALRDPAAIDQRLAEIDEALADIEDWLD
jgi:hypothetical protein